MNGLSRGLPVVHERKACVRIEVPLPKGHLLLPLIVHAAKGVHTAQPHRFKSPLCRRAPPTLKAMSWVMFKVSLRSQRNIVCMFVLQQR